ncbi:unnamed protein product, partial [Ectocarpus sp. 8 AP-2014]
MKRVRGIKRQRLALPGSVGAGACTHRNCFCVRWQMWSIVAFALECGRGALAGTLRLDWSACDTPLQHMKLDAGQGMPLRRGGAREKQLEAGKRDSEGDGNT